MSGERHNKLFDPQRFMTTASCVTQTNSLCTCVGGKLRTLLGVAMRHQRQTRFDPEQFFLEEPHKSIAALNNEDYICKYEASAV